MLTANFTASVSFLQVSFTDTSTGTPTSRVWDFGDGSPTSSATNPVHTYAVEGRYTVILTVDDGLDTDVISKTVRVTANNNSFQRTVSGEQLTFETDNIRPASHPSIIKDQNGRLVIFYEKELVSGKTSGGRVTTSGGFNVDIEAGSGTLNGATKSWASTTLTAVPNQFQLVYFNPTIGALGQLGITASFSMTLTKKVIPLAYVFSGVSFITSIYVIEKTGKYIFARRQKGGPTVWTFDDFEDILNIGEAPTASFDSTSNKIYVDHVRNGLSYRRTIQVGTEGSAWLFITDYDELTGNILRPPDFVNELIISASGTPVIGSITNTFEQLYDTSTDSTIITKNSVLSSGLFSKTKTKFLGGTFFMSPSGLHGFNNDFLNPGYSNDFLVYLPYIVYIAPVSILNVTFYEVYGPDNATLLLSIPYSSFFTWYNLNAFVGTTLYFGWRGTVSVYPNGTSIFNFVLPEDDRIKLHSISNSNKVDLSPTQINTEPRDTIEYMMSSSLSIFNDIVTYTQALPSGNETEDSITINGTISGSGLPLVTALA